MFRQLVWLTTPKKFCTKEIGFGPHLKSQKYQQSAKSCTVRGHKNFFVIRYLSITWDPMKTTIWLKLSEKNYFHL